MKHCVSLIQNSVFNWQQTMKNSNKLEFCTRIEHITRCFKQLYHILIFSALILKVQPTRFSPTNDDDLPPVVHGEKTIPCSLNI